MRAFRVPLACMALIGLTLALSTQPPGSAASSSASPAELFGSKCAMCHGKNGTGLPNWRAKGQPDFTDAVWQKSHTDAQIADAIANGKGKNMPSFKTKLSEGDINALVGQVRLFGRKK